MKNETLLLIFGLIVFILIIFRKPINMAISRGYKNNNPGNIRLTFDDKGNKTFWQGEIEGKDKAFKTFKNMYYGYRAMFITLSSYLKKGYNTIEKIINRYAPAEDNNVPENYINVVVIRSGISRNKVITDDDDLKKVIAAMSYVENGVTADIDSINKGYKLFKII